MNSKLLVTILFAVVLLGGILFLIGRHEDEFVSDKKISVVTSFYPLYFFASQIGGDKATVVNLTPAGAEPHDYELTARDIARIADSKLLVLNGGSLEAWAGKVSQSINPAKTTVVVAGEGLTTQDIVEEGESIVDPHVWLSPLLAQQMIGKIKDGFIAVDPSNTSYYEENADRLGARLSELDKEYQSLSACGKSDFITSHAAFGYLASTYHLNQIPIAGLSPDADPSAQQMAGIAKFAKDNGVKIIFFESLVSPELSQTLAREVGAQTLVLDPIEGLTDNDMQNGKNYFTQMESNLANLKIALECKQ